MSPATLQDNPPVESLFNVAETETLALFEHLSFEFLEEFDVFAPSPPGRTREHEPSELMHGLLHCYYLDIYGIQEWLDVQSRFHDYSHRNTLLIKLQCPEATKVAGYNTGCVNFGIGCTRRRRLGAMIRRLWWGRC